jgi:ATP-dependent RNA helicase DDX35
MTAEIPQYLLEAGYGLKGNCIGVTLPRRIGVISVASRVADEVGTLLGHAVGYSVRFNSKFNQGTCIKYLTDGSLVREIMQDPLLKKYSVIMIDDVHERSVSTDLLMGLLRKIRRKRTDLKLVISSATIEAGKLARYFEDKEIGLETKVMCIQGRVYPVKNYFLDHSVKNYLTAAASLIKDIHLEKPNGDILVFLPGVEEIETVQALITDLTPVPIILQLHAKLSLEKQVQVFKKISTDKSSP